MNMVRHNHKLMQQIFPLIAIAEQNIQEQPSHSVRLEHAHFLITGGGEKVRTQAGVSPIWNGQNLTSAAEAGYLKQVNAGLKACSTQKLDSTANFRIHRTSLGMSALDCRNVGFEKKCWV